MTSDDPGIVVRTEGATGVMELARPSRQNALRPADRAALRAGLRRFEADPALRSVLIRAQGDAFCTGVDLDAFAALRQDPKALAAFLAEGHELLAALEASALPVVAAVRGLCLAGGLELVMGCDIVIASREARFGDQHARFGLVPAWGGSQRLPRLAGLRRALDLMLTGRWIGAEEAASWGLVSRVVEPDALDAVAAACCADLATRSAAGLAAMKRLARVSLAMPLDEGLRQEAAEALPLLLGPDATEGLAAFRARRRPGFA
ncbi:MAG: enoyl-CoA hydratase/isomerase family protein [Acetobacteraceae bacterium]|nr:enoyl-CoA hydratase/isomerase family protein [Acetobacteraceae bacterium]